MKDPLIKEAEALAERVGYSPSGYLLIQKTATRGFFAGQTGVVLLAFYSAKELGQGIEWASKNGYQLLQPDTFNGHDTGMPEKVSGNAPKCPKHPKQTMQWSDKNQEWFCSMRVAGGYCDEVKKPK